MQMWQKSWTKKEHLHWPHRHSKFAPRKQTAPNLVNVDHKVTSEHHTKHALWTQNQHQLDFCHILHHPLLVIKNSSRILHCFNHLFLSCIQCVNFLFYECSSDASLGHCGHFGCGISQIPDLEWWQHVPGKERRKCTVCTNLSKQGSLHCSFTVFVWPWNTYSVIVVWLVLVVIISTCTTTPCPHHSLDLIGIN